MFNVPRINVSLLNVKCLLHLFVIKYKYKKFNIK